MKILRILILLGGLSACVIHPLKRHPKADCRELYLMFQDSIHWRYDSLQQLYLPSKELETLVFENKDCFNGLNQNKIIRMVGEPTSVFYNEVYDWTLVKYIINEKCRERDPTGCKELVFYTNPNKGIIRVVISEMEAP